jgi:hypothetical protein
MSQYRFPTVTEQLEPGVYKAVYKPLKITAQDLLSVLFSCYVAFYLRIPFIFGLGSVALVRWVQLIFPVSHYKIA